MVTEVVTKHPLGAVYVMMAVPEYTPATIPVPLPTVAVAEALQRPPDVGSASVVDAPWQTCVSPVMAEGSGSTVKGEDVIQPVGNVYVTISVPAVMPVTMPVVGPIPAIAA
jgi:hypothetical protein